MKTTLSLFFAVLFFSQAIAQQSNLTIFSENGNPFYLILNGIRQNEKPETNVRVNGLTNAYYTAKIIFDNQNLPAIDRKMLMVVDADGMMGEVTYKITNNNKGEQILRYFSFTPAAQVLPPPANVTVVSYNTTPLPAITFNTHVVETTTTTVDDNYDNVNIGINVGGISVGANVNVNDNGGYSQSIQTTTTTTTTNQVPQQVVVQQPVVVQQVQAVCYPMERNMFQNALNSIKGQSFSDTQLSQAKTITQANCLTALQIKQVCDIFSFEDTKLEYAKFAFDFCYDRNNYWQINETFSFSSSVSELNNYISGR
jgi:hypothetical protein